MSEIDVLYQKGYEGDLVYEPSNDKEGYQGTRSTLFTDPNTGKRYPILNKYSPNLLVNNILGITKRKGFSVVSITGESGSGKTTCATMLAHYIHTKESYNVHWFLEDELKQFKKIVHSLQKGVNHLLIFDDASFSLDDLKKDQLKDIQTTLTSVRHIVRGNVIFMPITHYDKAIGKFFRVGGFKILTSIDTTAFDSYQDLFGAYSRYKLKDFLRYYKHMMIDGRWKVLIDQWEGKRLSFETDKPFRLAIVNEIDGLHFFVYLDYSCASCINPRKDKDYSHLDARQMYDTLIKKYPNKYELNSILKHYAFTQHNLNVLDTKRLSIWRTIARLDQSSHIDWHEVEKILGEHVRKRPRAYIKKGSVEKNVKDIQYKDDLIVN